MLLSQALINGQVGGFVLAIVIFMAIILYGQWIAYSVAEEKNSRVMEVVLAAATPFQLLSGKVIGVGALAILQYFIVAIPMILAIVFLAPAEQPCDRQQLDRRERDEVVGPDEHIELGRVQALDRPVVDGEVEDAEEVPLVGVVVDLRALAP